MSSIIAANPHEHRENEVCRFLYFSGAASAAPRFPQPRFLTSLTSQPPGAVLSRRQSLRCIWARSACRDFEQVGVVDTSEQRNGAGARRASAPSSAEAPTGMERSSGLRLRVWAVYVLLGTRRLSPHPKERILAQRMLVLHRVKRTFRCFDGSHPKRLSPWAAALLRGPTGRLLLARHGRLLALRGLTLPFAHWTSVSPLRRTRARRGLSSTSPLPAPSCI